jgi:hypothetical protein
MDTLTPRQAEEEARRLQVADSPRARMERIFALAETNLDRMTEGQQLDRRRELGLYAYRSPALMDTVTRDEFKRTTDTLRLVFERAIGKLDINVPAGAEQLRYNPKSGRWHRVRFAPVHLGVERLTLDRFADDLAALRGIGRCTAPLGSTGPCNQLFVIHRAGQRYCSPACQIRVNVAKYRARLKAKSPRAQKRRAR